MHTLIEEGSQSNLLFLPAAEDQIQVGDPRSLRATLMELHHNDEDKEYLRKNTSNKTNFDFFGQLI